MNKKLDIGFVRAEFVKEGYKLITKIYENFIKKTHLWDELTYKKDGYVIN